MPVPESKTVAIAARDEDLRLLLKLVLRGDDRLTLVHEAASTEELVAAVAVEAPDAIVLDDRLDGVPDADLPSRPSALAPRTTILLLAGPSGAEDVGSVAIDAVVRKDRLTQLAAAVAVMLELDAADTES